MVVFRKTVGWAPACAVRWHVARVVDCDVDTRQRHAEKVREAVWFVRAAAQTVSQVTNNLKIADQRLYYRQTGYRQAAAKQEIYECVEAVPIDSGTTLRSAISPPPSLRPGRQWYTPMSMTSGDHQVIDNRKADDDV